mmetsp:Transcript_15524/g.22902  ORF Transcript_15524/g.22902 Transcript_15524/m.22902 type:complete len:201 (+) Transcript_15524:583-1185(+)
MHCHERICASNSFLPPLIKFPRTAHLIDMGASTPDDIISSSVGLEHICDGRTSVIVEEKVDGANLGISLCPRTGKLLAQNRSHYISSNEHAQFSRLAEWLSEHEQALKELLQTTSNELILYGEWMAARHSIPYHNLPGLFIAFDLYDKTKQKFLPILHYYAKGRNTSSSYSRSSNIWAIHSSKGSKAISFRHYQTIRTEV